MSSAAMPRPSSSPEAAARRERVLSLIEMTYADPAAFIRIATRTKLRTWQKDACEKIRQNLLAQIAAHGREHSRIRGTFRTCHGAGKTFFMAGLLLWWQTTRINARGLTLAPTWAQIESSLWPEVGKLYNRSAMKAVGRTNGRDGGSPLMRTRLDYGETWFAEGRSSDRPGNLEGQHSDFAALRIIDEAKEVPDPIFEATEGLLNAPHSCDLWISTPSLESGRFYERDTGRDEDVIRVRVTVDDLVSDPEMTEGERQGFARWKAERVREWGKDSPEYRTRVLAEYADNAEGALFPSSWIERAMSDREEDGSEKWRLIERDEYGRPPAIRAGMDVAGSIDGDRNAVAVVRGPDPKERFQVVSVSSWHERDTMTSKGRALAIARNVGAPLRVDVIGLGKGVADAARAEDYLVEDYRASDKALDHERFGNRKAEDAWRLRVLLEQGRIRLPKDQALKADLRAMKYEIRQNGKLYVVDPSQSPDLADSVIIALGVSRVGIGSMSPEWL